MLLLLLVIFQQSFAAINFWTERLQCSSSGDQNLCLKKVYTKHVILQKRVLEKEVKNWEKYVTALDIFFEKHNNEREKIEDILLKIQGIEGKLWSSVRDKNIYEIIRYIEYKWNLMLLSIPQEKIVLENDENIFDFSEEELMEYLEGLTVQELEVMANSFYQNESELYLEIIELYQTQIQKARDTSRISDIKALQAAVEQVYQDTAEYPTKSNFEELTSIYMPRKPKDPLAGYTINGCDFWYHYEVGIDANWIRNSHYKISTCFEHPDNIQKRADNTADRWDDNLKLEIGYWNENTIFTEDFFINDISSWEKYNEDTTSINSGNLDSLDEESKRGILYYVIYLKYIEENPEILEQYNIDARNAKVSSDIRMLVSALEFGIVDRDIDFTQLIVDSSEKSYSHEIWVIHSGNINFPLLMQNKEDFESPWDWYPYQVAYIESDFRGAKYRMYQFLWYKHVKENTYEVFLKWNYVKIDTTYPDSLFKNPITWEYFKNGDTFIVK